eukprot:9230946-Pyramimonas_sp.AAC.1
MRRRPDARSVVPARMWTRGPFEHKLRSCGNEMRRVGNGRRRQHRDGGRGLTSYIPAAHPTSSAPRSLHRIAHAI